MENSELRKRLKAARNFPENTCPASRHTQIIGEALLKGRPYPMLADEPKHCAESMLYTVVALYETRTELARLRAEIAGAPVGFVVEVGDDDEGQPRALVHSTRDELRKGPALAFKRVALLRLPAGEAA